MELFLQKIKDGNLLEKGCFKAVNFYNAQKNNYFCYGNLWCWTSSNYLPYDGFRSYDSGLNEYNAKFMCNQFVLKGGHLPSLKIISDHHIETFIIIR